MAHLLVVAYKIQSKRHSNARADRRLSELGGHDPENPILHSGWLTKQAVTARMNKNWKRRYFIIRKDRFEYHWAVPMAGHVPRGFVEMTPTTVIERMPPTFRRGHTVLMVKGKTETLYVHAMGEKEITRLEENLKATVAGLSAEASGDVKAPKPSANEEFLKAESEKQSPMDEGDPGSDTDNEFDVEGLEALLAELSIANKLSEARKWCTMKGAESLEDLREEDYAEQLVKALDLPEIKGKRLVKAIKAPVSE